ncbi:unnamed protein product [Penicillium glandicola]
MPSLMDLPKEIRAMILDKVINGRRTPPISPSKSNMVHLVDMRYKVNMGHLNPYHEKCDTHSPSNSLPLLLTSRQISIETEWVLNRMKKTTYILDISVQNELDLFSTWISVPRLTTRLSTLHVDVRLFGHIITNKAVSRQMGCGERFLQYGPVGAKKCSGDHFCEDRKVCVENLVLNFHSAETNLPYPPDNIAYTEWVAKHCGRPWSIDKQTDMSVAYKTRPEWLLCYLAVWLQRMAGMWYHEANYGALIYETIGTITILLDGRLDTTIDLADRLAKLEFDNATNTMGHLPREIRLSEFWKWKKATILRREALGFPVVQPQVPERE